MLSFRTAVLGLFALSSVHASRIPEAFRIEQVEKNWMEAAKKACALVEATNFETCVLEVVAASDLSKAEAHRPSQPKQEGIHEMYKNAKLLTAAKKACENVVPLDYDLCIEDVMDYGDLRIVDNFPKKAGRRLLRGSNDDHDEDAKLLRLAREACALVQNADRHLCVQDVLATRDVGIAVLWPKDDAPTPKNDEPEDKLLAQAKEACRLVKSTDRLLCIEDVLFTRDLGNAELWPIETRRRRLSEKKLLKEAKEACQYVKEVDRRLCIDDVLMTKDVGIAELWPKSLPVHYQPNKEGRRLTDKLILKEAKEACRSVKAEHRQFCIDDVLMTGDGVAAEWWTKNLPVDHWLSHKLLQEAKEACVYLKVLVPIIRC